MRAVLVDDFGGREVLRLGEIEPPPLRPGDVRVDIAAAGVNPLDAIVRAGFGKDIVPTEFPFVPGHDFAGTIAEAGAETSRFAVGDEVWGYHLTGLIKWGTYAESIVLPESFVGRKPRSIGFEEAAALPIPALTCLQLLEDWAKIAAGETILIHAGAGGVGSIAVQLAKHRGLEVLTTASGRNHPYLRELGADHVIDYNWIDFREPVLAAHPDGVDVVLFTITIVDDDFDYGADTLRRSVDVLKDGGQIDSPSGSRLASIVNMEALGRELDDHDVNYKYVSCHPAGEQLEVVADLVDEGHIRPPRLTVMPLSEAQQAHQLIESKHVTGKVVLTVP
jgi:NADPH:quinone reductase-like Zn-dependent oxidoreductase